MKTTKLYYVITNGDSFILADNGEVRTVLSGEAALLPSNDYSDADSARQFLSEIFQCSVSDGWEEFEQTAEEIIGDCEVLASVEVAI